MFKKTPQNTTDIRKGAWYGKEYTYTGFSKYWLKDSYTPQTSYFDQHGQFDTKLPPTSKINTHKLVSLQSAISNFVYILTQDRSITVNFNTNGSMVNSFSVDPTKDFDDKVITLSPKLEDDKFDEAVGLALHEASHALYTDMATAGNDVRGRAPLENLKFSKEITTHETAKSMYNIIEDMYIDAKTYKEAVGYRGYYTALYLAYLDHPGLESFYRDPKSYLPLEENYVAHVCMLRSRFSQVDALPGLKEISDLIDMPNILRLTTQQDRTDLFNKVMDVVCQHTIGTLQQPQPQSGTGDGEGDEKTLGELLDDDSLKLSAGNHDGEAKALKAGPPLTKAQQTKLDNLLKKVKDFTNGKVKKGKITAAEAQRINNLVKLSYNTSETEYNGVKIRTIILEDVNKVINSSCGSDFGVSRYISPSKHNSVTRGISNGKALANKLQLRTESRNTDRRYLKSGKMDKTRLYNIGNDIYNVFKKVEIDSYSESYIHLCVDSSGSMDGVWGKTLELMAVMATASTFISNLHFVISVRTTTGNGDDCQPFLLYCFDSKKHKVDHIKRVFPMLTTPGTTPEGLVFDAIFDEIQTNSIGKSSYFINICDGEPYCSGTVGADGMSMTRTAINVAHKLSRKTGVARQDTYYDYSGSSAMKHTREKYNKMKQYGIIPLTFFIGARIGHDSQLKATYGADAVAHLSDSGNNFNDVAKYMNKMLLKK